LISSWQQVQLSRIHQQDEIRAKLAQPPREIFRRWSGVNEQQPIVSWYDLLQSLHECRAGPIISPQVMTHTDNRQPG
jgi:hypothetical protein